ncbi:Transcription factor A, mitochondrial [Fusarium austroafricanum]|uniref:Transcription factor A, mitochondrial n=1 Tax=Fusarium austroafricanum TaxID=2364996 RepID=A0A8H4NT06_9HYPO|nr:Transcription factor A, mitochondrial [Fusarium austroafricanum]
MLTSVGRAAARRVQTSRLSASTPSAAQLICRQSAVTFTLPIRRFSASAWPLSPAVGDKKAAAKKTTTTKKATTTTKSKSKSKAADTKSKKKAMPKPKAAATKPKKPKKEVDPEKLKKLEIRELKKWVLKDKLAQLPASSWLLYTTENRGSSAGNGGITQQIPELAENFRRLDESEVKELARRAAANRQKNLDNYKAWVETHEPARIHLANKSRRRLAFLTGKPAKMITDERLPQRPSGAYAIYVAENFDSFGRSETNQPMFKEIGQAWKGLNPTEKARYEERAADQSVRYKAEMEKVEARAKAIQETEVA